jgi:hypothetical protein
MDRQGAFWLSDDYLLANSQRAPDIREYKQSVLWPLRPVINFWQERRINEEMLYL